ATHAASCSWGSAGSQSVVLHSQFHQAPASSSPWVIFALAGISVCRRPQHGHFLAILRVMRTSALWFCRSPARQDGLSRTGREIILRIGRALESSDPADLQNLEK